MNRQQSAPGTRYGLISLLVFFGALLAYFLVFGIFEQALLGLSDTAERWLTLILLVFPALIGVILGAFGLMRTGQNRLLAALGLVLNALFALFILFVLSFAG